MPGEMGGGISAGRNGGYFCWQISWLSPNMLADFLTVSKSAGRNGGSYFCWQSSCHQICQQKWVFLLADFLTVNKSAGRNEGSYSCWQSSCHQICQWKWGYFCWQISWLSPNLLAENRGCISAGRFPVTKSASGNGGYFCWQKWGDVFLLADFLSPNLPAGMVAISAVSKSAGRNEGGYFC